jgi:hypothetical protein
LASLKATSSLNGALRVPLSKDDSRERPALKQDGGIMTLLEWIFAFWIVLSAPVGLLAGMFIKCGTGEEE